MPLSGNSPLMASTLSPNCSSIVRIGPPGSETRLVSGAPSTDTYQAAARAGSRVTRWLVKVPMHGYHIGCLDELSRHIDDGGESAVSESGRVGVRSWREDSDGE